MAKIDNGNYITQINDSHAIFFEFIIFFHFNLSFSSSCDLFVSEVYVVNSTLSGSFVTDFSFPWSLPPFFGSLNNSDITPAKTRNIDTHCIAFTGCE